jgi:hypothetical protein
MTSGGRRIRSVSALGYVHTACPNSVQISAVRRHLISITGSQYFVRSTIRHQLLSSHTNRVLQVNIFTDVIIICLPITMVSRLQMKLKQKLGVAAVFSLGFFVVIASSKFLLDSRHITKANASLQLSEPITPRKTRLCSPALSPWLKALSPSSQPACPPCAP